MGHSAGFRLVIIEESHRCLVRECETLQSRLLDLKVFRYHADVDSGTLPLGLNVEEHLHV